MSDYKLRKTDTGRKNGRYHYEVLSPSGDVVSERRSNRDYVAANINGAFYFGRVDLVGKGEHGLMLRMISEGFCAKGVDPEAFRKELETIAYLTQ